MTHAIQTLEKEKQLLTDCLSDWDLQQYPEARKEREIKLKEINNALEKLRL